MAKQKKRGSPIYRLPPYRVEAVFAAKAQVVDWGLSALNIPSFWKATRGKGVRVAVIDTGIAMNHSDLRDAIIVGKDFTNSPSGWGDLAGHGTHTAGTIAARDDAGGVVGVAPEAGLLVGKVLGDNGSGSSAGVAAGIRWAIEQKADIISMSLGTPQPDSQIKAAVNAAIAAGIFVIAAAGNEGPNLDTVGYPAAFPGVISVGAIDQNKLVANFSSRGQRVDVCAPGVGIVSCYPPNGLAKLSGTSMATPFVSGVVALIIAKHREHGGATPIETPAQMIEHLHKTAIDIDAPGFDPNAGWGIINPADLLKDDVLPPPAVPSLTFGPDDFTASGQAKIAAIRGPASISVRLN